MNESNRFDITCQRFGRLTALRIVEGIDSKATWECRCDCGKMKNVSYHNLVQGRTKSCGCSRSLSLAKDLSGRRFGRLTAIEPTGEKKSHCFLWRCRCDCGKEVVVTSNALLMGNTRSCGCLSRDLKMENYKDLRSQRFGRLVALEPTDKRRGGSVIWRCQCDCGKISYHKESVLQQGKVNSCGCLKHENDALRRSLHYVDQTCVEFIENTGKVSKRNTSGYRGVKSAHGKWIASITFQKKTYYLGTYSDKEDAIRVRKQAEDMLFGDFLDWFYGAFPEEKRQRKKRNSKQDAFPVESQMKESR